MKKMYVGGAFSLTMSTSVKTVFPTLKANSQTMPISAHDYTSGGSSTQRSGTLLVYFNAKINTNYTTGQPVTDGSAMIATQTASSSFTGTVLKLSTTVASSDAYEFIHVATSFNEVNWTYGIAPDGNTEKWYRNITGVDSISINGDGTMYSAGGIHAAMDSSVGGNMDITAGGVETSGGNIVLSTTAATQIVHTGESGGAADLSISSGGDVIIENVRIGPHSGLSNLYWNLKFISSATTLTASDAGAKAMLDSAGGCALTLPDCTVSTIGFHVEVVVKTASTSNGYTIAAAGGSSDVFEGALVLSTGSAIAMVSNANTVYLKAGDGTKPGAVGSRVDFLCRESNAYYVRGIVLTTVNGATGSALNAAV